MDIALEICDKYVFDHLYSALLPASNVATGLSANSSLLELSTASPWQYTPSTKFISFEPGQAAYTSRWYRDNTYRQLISLYLITWLLGATIYFVVASISYVFVFDKTTFKHPKYLKNQIKMEIRQAVDAMPFIAILTTPFFFAEVRGYSKLYDALADGPGTWYDFAQFPLFLIFTDFWIYLIHRGLHHPMVYKHLHKPHHKWIMPTPYAAVAFHPVDGFLQSVPYHVFPFLFPLQKFAYLGLFGFIQIWTVLIHDGEYISNNPILNGAACHTEHHLFFNYNFGQYTTLWDRLGGTYRKPSEDLFKKETKMAEKEWKKQVVEMEKIQKEVEGENDFRTYLSDKKNL